MATNVDQYGDARTEIEADTCRVERMSENELDNLLHQLHYALHVLDTMHWVHDGRIERAYDEIVRVTKEAIAERVRRLSSLPCASRDEIDEAVRRFSQNVRW